MRNGLRTSVLVAASSALALGAVLPALAQDPAPAAPAAPSAEQPAAPAAPAAPSTDQPAAPAAPADAAQAPAAAAEPPPTLPTTGDGAVVVNLLTQVCEPIVSGQKLDDVAKQMKLRKDRKTQTYTIPLADKTPYKIAIQNQGVNRNVCELWVDHAPGGDRQIIDALNVWRYLHKPQMFLHRNEQGASITGVTATTITWDNRANIANDGAMYGLATRQVKNPGGKGQYDQTIVQYTIRKAS